MNGRVRGMLYVRKDAEKVILLVSYLFFTSMASVVGKTCADALFLSQSTPDRLSYMYVPVALSSIIAGMLYQRLIGKVRQDHLLYAILAVLVVFILVVRIGMSLGFAATYSILYVGADVCNFLMIVGFWAFATYVLDAGEARRYIRWIGSGGMLGGMLGGFGIKLLVQFFAMSNLLYVYAFLIVCCIGIVMLFIKRSKVSFSDPVHEHTGPKRKGQQKSDRLFAEIPHLRYIIMIVFTINVVLTLIDYQFKIVATSQYQDAALAAFLGTFSGFSSVLALLFQVLLSGFLMARYGVLVSLLVLPVFLLTGSFGLFLLPGLFFAVMLKGGDKVFSDTIYSAANQLLYIPIPAQLRGGAKMLVDGVIRPISKGAAAVFLVLISGFLSVSQMSLLVIALLVCAIVAMIKIKGEYVQALLSTLQVNQFDWHNQLHFQMDSTMLRVMEEHLRSTDEVQVMYALDMLRQADVDIRPYVADLLTHPSDVVKIRALHMAEEMTPDAAFGPIRNLLTVPQSEVRAAAIQAAAAYARDEQLTELTVFLQDEKPSVRAAAASGLIVHYGMEGMFYAIETLKMLLESKKEEERKEAAIILGKIGIAGFHKPLLTLLEDPAISVRMCAIESASIIKANDLLPALLRNLENKETAEQVARALAAYPEEDLHPLLDGYFLHSCKHPKISLRLPSVLARKISLSNARLLIRQYEHAFPQLAGKIADELWRYASILQEVDREQVKASILREIDAFFFFTDRLSILYTIEGMGHVAAAVEDVRRQITARMFSLLAVLYDAATIRSVSRHAFSTDRTAQSNALEILDTLVEGTLRKQVLKLLQTGPIRDQKERAESVDEGMLYDLFTTEYPWLQMCVEHAIRTTNFALWKEMEWRIADVEVLYDRTEVQEDVEKVLLLQKIEIFSELTPEELVAIVARVTKETAEAGQAIIEEREYGDSLYVLLKGNVGVYKEGRKLGELTAGDCFGEMAVLDGGPRSASIAALEETTLFRLDATSFYESMEERTEIARAIMKLLCRRLRHDLKRLPTSEQAGREGVEVIRVEQEREEDEALRFDNQEVLNRILALKKIELFASLSNEELALLAGVADEQSYQMEETVFLEGEYGDSMYVVMEGVVRIHRGGEVLALLGEEEYFGEMAVLDGETRSASATIEQDAVLLCLSSDVLYALCFRHVEIMKKMIAVFVRRLRETNEKLT